ncbi:UDP-glucose 4-epimerase [Sulfurifustis variabilis]|uniref:UDP-glucose 4-epimerase n=1 Tax=Sulfurifustis variabilis TaxID=1675686 RepID=A0A1B4V4X8_9GAMM|nr:UDP-glucose 4-epimerase GalE [Sulfurifustis variabilis]BAU48593.1 UDP-glucose 4-epimerase [Sulfurifustis variabilis]
MRVLVTGGAGYIGSHMVKMLLGQGAEVATLDDLSCGYRDAVVGGEFVKGDTGDRACLDALFGRRKFDAVMHFASFIQVGESVRDPAKYYRNNVTHTLTLLDAMAAHGVRSFVFSSSAAIFGEPDYTPIDEAHPKRPINPYGFSKWAVERVLSDYDRAYGLKSVSLRYFNAAGADPDGQLGERHEPETHLIPLVLQAAAGRRPSVSVFGDDYPTPDGTCVRDYIHIVDLCQAHLLALERLRSSGQSAAYNLGNSRGYSVNEVIRTVEAVTGRTVPVERAPRREGDPAVLVADSKRAMDELGWRPRFNELETIIRHAWTWEQKRHPTATEPGRRQA